MRNFIAFLKRFQVILFFALLQGLALAWYFTFSYFPRTQYLTTANNVSGSILSMQNDVSKHFKLEEDNKKLQEENVRLRNQLKESKLLLSSASFIDSVQLIKGDSVIHYEYIPGQVIRSTLDRSDNYFTINIGTRQGVKRGMGVISTNGIVGVIHFAGDRFSVVKSCLTKNINVDVMLEKSEVQGLLKWDGNSYRSGNLTGISNDTEIKKWSKVVTRGTAGIFPRGLSVGKVKSVDVIEGESLWDVKLVFAEDFSKTYSICVVKNILLDEQREVESNIPNE